MQLSGIRILDLTRIISGPFCSMLLADMGAEVIKVESPGAGDAVRAQGVIKDGLSWYFAGYNRNKKSVTLDLYTDEGKAVLADLIRHSDVLVENFRPGVMERMGFGPERLRALRPDLVYCSINGFGSTGPYKDRPAFDFIAQAMSGFMSLNGGAGDPPLRTGPPISDLVAGLYGALGIAGALVRRQATGQGETVNVSLTMSLVALLSFQASNYFADGRMPPRTGNEHPIVAPYGLFRTRDGQLAVAPSNDAVYGKLLDALDLRELADDPRFASNADRLRNRAQINAAVEARMQTQDSDYWIDRLNRYGVPCGRVLDLPQVFADPQVLDQQMVMDVEHPGHGTVRMLGFPIKYEQAPCEARLPAPELGAHTEDVLRGLGYDEDRIARLRRQRTI